MAYAYGPDGKDTAFWVADPALSRRVLCRHIADEFRTRWDKSGLVIGAPRRRLRQQAAKPKTK